LIAVVDRKDPYHETAKPFYQDYVDAGGGEFVSRRWAREKKIREGDHPEPRRGYYPFMRL
jgi:hypothetical protein